MVAGRFMSKHFIHQEGFSVVFFVLECTGLGFGGWLSDFTKSTRGPEPTGLGGVKMMGGCLDTHFRRLILCIVVVFRIRF